MRFSLALAAVVTAATLSLPAFADTVRIEMDQQINVGMPGTAQSPSGNAIYVPNFGPGGTPTGTLDFMTDGSDGWARTVVPGNANPDPALRQGWWYMYADPTLAGLGPIDLSAADSTLSFDARYFQDPQTNSNPYGDAPVFLRLYTYGGPTFDILEGYRDYSILYGPKPDPRYPEWVHVSIDPLVAPHTDGGAAFDPSRVTRIRWYGTDWSGAGNDFIDIKNLTLSGDKVVPPIPEPASLALLLTGVLPFMARRRKA